MGLNKKSVDDINVKGLRVLCRCDFNVPLKEGKITDENRLVAALPTIKKLVADGGKVILCSHLGKPKGEPNPELSLAPVAARLTELLGQEVKFAADNEVVGPNAKAAVEAMKDGDIAEEEKQDALWRDNAAGLAKFWSDNNSEYDYGELTMYLNRHLDMIKNIMEAELSGDYNEVIRLFAEQENQIMELADYLTEGLIQKFL